MFKGLLSAALRHRCGRAAATRRSETQTLRDRRRWSYAPCGVLLALAFTEADSPLAQWCRTAGGVHSIVGADAEVRCRLRRTASSRRGSTRALTHEQRPGGFESAGG